MLVISIGGIVYFNFFAGPPKSATVSPDEVKKIMAGATPSVPGAAGGAARPTAKKSKGGFLPYGSKIETGILEEDKYQALKGQPPLTVTDAELGKDDLFAK